MKSRAVLEALVVRFDLVKHFAQEDTQHAIDQLQKSVNIKAAGNGLVTVSVDDEDPNVAAAVANAYIQEIGKVLSRWSFTESQQRLKFFERQVAVANDKLGVAKREVRSRGLSADFSKSSSFISMGGIARLDAHIAAKEIKLASMRSYVAESSFDYQQAEFDLRAMRSHKILLEAAPIEPAGDVTIMAHYRELAYQESLLELLTWQYEVARVEEMRDDETVMGVDAAAPPGRPNKPDRARISGIASIATVFVLMIVVFIRHGLRNLATHAISARKLWLLRNAFRKALGLKLAAT